MKTLNLSKPTLGVLALVTTLFAAGCNDTAKGMSKDSKEVGHEVRQTSKDASAAVALTPMVKAALVANPFLNKDGNAIDVDSTSDSVILKGHVTSEKNKEMAAELALKVIKDNSSENKLVNELKVIPATS